MLTFFSLPSAWSLSFTSLVLKPGPAAALLRRYHGSARVYWGTMSLTTLTGIQHSLFYPFLGLSRLPPPPHWFEPPKSWSGCYFLLHSCNASYQMYWCIMSATVFISIQHAFPPLMTLISLIHATIGLNGLTPGLAAALCYAQIMPVTVFIGIQHSLFSSLSTTVTSPSFISLFKCSRCFDFCC